jgi:hypothetical protein
MLAILYPQEDFWYSFLLEAELDPTAILQLEGLGKFKKNPSHRDSNPQPSGL